MLYTVPSLPLIDKVAVLPLLTFSVRYVTVSVPELCEVDVSVVVSVSGLCKVDVSAFVSVSDVLSKT